MEQNDHQVGVNEAIYQYYLSYGLNKPSGESETHVLHLNGSLFGSWGLR